MQARLPVFEDNAKIQHFRCGSRMFRKIFFINFCSLQLLQLLQLKNGCLNGRKITL